MSLSLRDSLSGARKKVRGRPDRPVELYVCGPTVYAPSHVGHARTYIEFDLIRRTLEADDRSVRHVMNITDFEDKISARAQELGVSWRSLARSEEARFFRDIDALRVKRPHYRPRASAFVPQMIEVARRLEKTGRVHRRGEEWVYDPPKRARGQNFPTGEALAVHAVPEPGHPFPRVDGEAGEFMVWRRQDPPLPSWRSPWGRGMPGWHLECYSMAEKLLGIPVGVHGGGRDLIFPHHFAENEIALSLARRPFSRLFVHMAFVTQNGLKMAKSTGDLVSIQEALSSASADGLRWYLTGLPYTERLEWDDAAYARAAAEFDIVRASLRDWTSPGAGGRYGARHARALAEGVRRDLSDDLRTDRVIQRFRRFIERLRSDPSDRVARGERSAALAALRSIEERTGLALLAR